MIFIIHSLDETTNFLSVIPEFLQKQGVCDFKHYVLNHQQGSIEEISDLLARYTDQALVIFLGHGASHCIYCPIILPSESKQPLINRENFHVLNKKAFISLSCRSAEFIQNNYTDGPAMLGFDDLPTHWDDVIAQREVDAGAYPGITDSVLESYRTILANIFAKTLADTILSKEKNFTFFYRRLRLYINKYIALVNESKISDNPTLMANLLFDLKQGVKLFGDINQSLYYQADQGDK